MPHRVTNTSVHILIVKQSANILKRTLLDNLENANENMKDTIVGNELLNLQVN